jgi:glucokinase
VDELWPEEMHVVSIGIAVPGPLDPKAGILFSAPNIPEWVDLPLQQKFADRFRVPCAIGNDANMAALGECRFGAGVGHKDMIYITISTGIGGGVILDNQLVLGAHGLACELGHITVDPDGPVCSCGQRGHLEAFSSGPSIVKYVLQQTQSGRSTSLDLTQKISAKDVSVAAGQGDALSLEALGRSARYMGVALADFLHIFNPTMIVLGGGVTRSGSIYLDPVKEILRSRVMDSEYLVGLEIATAALGDDAGLLGTLELARSLSAERQMVDDV